MHLHLHGTVKSEKVRAESHGWEEGRSLSAVRSLSPKVELGVGGKAQIGSVDSDFELEIVDSEYIMALHVTRLAGGEARRVKRLLRVYAVRGLSEFSCRSFAMFPFLRFSSFLRAHDCFFRASSFESHGNPGGAGMGGDKHRPTPDGQFRRGRCRPSGR